jgi:pyruvate dehydrogenase E2 component (dihydrolipoamide acetyltransferase)
MPTLLRMPAIAAGAETAVLSEWQVQEGVPFNKSDAIATVETDKAMVDMEAEDAGVILRFLVGSGEQVEVGAVIALSGTPGEAVDDIEAALRELERRTHDGPCDRRSGLCDSTGSAPGTRRRPGSGGRFWDRAQWSHRSP